MRNLVFIIVMFFAVLGPSLAIAYISRAALQAMGRNPSAAPKILMAMIVALIFAGAVSIVALLVTLQIFGA
jgi:F0F1-type ATP synthase membrane subunit c/vacuolar-type H+-ATPase subunit K